MSDQLTGQPGLVLGQHEYFQRWLELFVLGGFAVYLAESNLYFRLFVEIVILAIQTWFVVGRLRDLGYSTFISILVWVPIVNLVFMIALLFLRSKSHTTPAPGLWKSKVVAAVILGALGLWVIYAPEAQFDSLLAPATRDAIIIVLVFLVFSEMILLNMLGESLTDAGLPRAGSH